MATATVRHAGVEAVIVIAPLPFRMSRAGILDFMGHAVPTGGVQRVKEHNAAFENADRAHGQTGRTLGERRIGWQRKFITLALDAIGVAVVLKGGVILLDGKDPSRVIRQAVARDRSGRAGQRHEKCGVAPRDMSLYLDFLCRVPCAVTEDPLPCLVRTTASELRLARPDRARLRAAANSSVAEGKGAAFSGGKAWIKNKPDDNGTYGQGNQR